MCEHFSVVLDSTSLIHARDFTLSQGRWHIEQWRIYKKHMHTAERSLFTNILIFLHKT